MKLSLFLVQNSLDAYITNTTVELATCITNFYKICLVFPAWKTFFASAPKLSVSTSFCFAAFLDTHATSELLRKETTPLSEMSCLDIKVVLNNLIFNLHYFNTKIASTQGQKQSVALIFCRKERKPSLCDSHMHKQKPGPNSQNFPCVGRAFWASHARANWWTWFANWFRQSMSVLLPACLVPPPVRSIHSGAIPPELFRDRDAI